MAGLFNPFRDSNSEFHQSIMDRGEDMMRLLTAKYGVGRSKEESIPPPFRARAKPMVPISGNFIRCIDDGPRIAECVEERLSVERYGAENKGWKSCSEEEMTNEEEAGGGDDEIVAVEEENYVSENSEIVAVEEEEEESNASEEDESSVEVVDSLAGMTNIFTLPMFMPASVADTEIDVLFDITDRIMSISLDALFCK